MNRVIVAVLLCTLLCVGCASWELKGSTLAVSASIGTIIEQQILANLAQAYDSPYSIPAQSVLSQGAVQIQNQATAALKLPYTHTAASSKEGDPGVALQWQETWTIVPVMDSQDLDRLEYLYTGATMPVRPQKDNETLLGHFGHYLMFSVVKPSYGQQTGTCDDGAGVGESSHSLSPAAAASAASDPFQDCAKINALLKSAKQWLAFDEKPSEGTDSEVLDKFIDKGRVAHHRIWVRPKEFAQFTMYVLNAVPNSQTSASSGKGLSFSIQ